MNLHLAAPIQRRLAGYPFRVMLDGLVIGHYASHRTAVATAQLYPGSVVAA